MIPATYPSQIDSDNRTQAVIYYLTSITGLERWKDYIPVRESSLASPELNSFNTNGAILTTTLSSTTGKQAWVDYIPVYRDDLATDAWSVSATGYLATKDINSLQALAIIASYGTNAHVYLPGIGVINGLTAGNYLDSAGTTAATVDNPVGLVLDAAGNSISRRNLFTYSEQFDNASWVKPLATITPNTIIAPNGTLTADTHTSNATSSMIYKQNAWTFVNGQKYTVSRYVKAGSKAFCTIGMHQLADAYFDLNSLTYSFSGTGAVSASIVDVGDGWRRISATWIWGAATLYHVYFAMASSLSSQAGLVNGDYIYTWGAQLEQGATVTDYQQIVAGTGEWATGIHALQATTANKPILRRGAVNLLTYSEQFDNVAWSKSNITVSPDAINAPNGTLTADKLVEPVGSAQPFIFRSMSTTAGTHTVSYYLKAGERTWARIFGGVNLSSGFANFNLSSGAVGSSGNVLSTSITSEGDGWYRCSITCIATASSANSGVQILSGDTSAAYVGNGTSGLYIIGAMLNTGSLSTYVATTTAPASSPTGNYWWQFDSTDVLTATFPAGYESATTIDARTTGNVTLTAQNIVGAYNIGPSIDTYGRFVFRTGLTASELATMQQFANRLAGV